METHLSECLTSASHRHWMNQLPVWVCRRAGNPDTGITRTICICWAGSLVVASKLNWREVGV